MDDKQQGPEEVKWIREKWAELTNQHLEKHHHPERVDHRSYEEQGINKIPGTHLGVAATEMERRGIQSSRGDINRESNDLEKSAENTSEISNQKSQKQVEKLNKTEPKKTPDYNTLKTKKLKMLHTQVSKLQTQISQKILDIQDQKEELQDTFDRESNRFGSIFKKAQLKALKSDILKLESREKQLHKRFIILRRYTDKNRLGESRLEKRVYREMIKQFPGIFREVVVRKASVSKSRGLGR